MKKTSDILIAAKKASAGIYKLNSEIKNFALIKIADSIQEHTCEILAANKKDVAAAKSVINAVMLDRLTLTESRIAAMASGIREVTQLSDPVGRITTEIERPNGLVIEKLTVPMGVVAMIYESRPNVTSDAAALALKSGNVCILRSGKEAFMTSQAIVNAMRKALCECGLDENLINLIEDTSRESANELMTATEYVDLLIPRGGKGLIKACVDNAKVPCIQTGTGICHIYADDFADIDMVLNIVDNAKTSRPSVCNAQEVLLVHKDIAARLLPLMKKRLCDDRVKNGLVPVELRLDEGAAEIIEGTKAGKDDFDTEFLNYILAIKLVNGTDEAIKHIAEHSTHHSDGIITENDENAQLFLNAVDSAAVYVNASTRFTDGGEFGLGCEIGISTQKLHARGPMGLEALTTYKYIVRGNGQIR